MAKIAIYSLTMDRLEYTRHCFKRLKERSGMDYDHYVVDNGSKDGTVEWLKENEKNFKKVIYNPENLGIGKASNQALEEISKGNYDLIIKMDNDCEVETNGILREIAELYEEKWTNKKYAEKYILSPRVGGINTNLKIVKQDWMGKFLISFTGMVGGLFMINTPMILKDFRYREDLRRIGLDSQICHFMNQNGGRCGYIEQLKVNHYETTDGQAKRYPEYFEKKWREEKNDKEKL